MRKPPSTGAAGILAAILATFILASAAQAAQTLRWTGAEDGDASLTHVLAKIDEQTGLKLTTADFHLGEDRALAFEHYRRYDQVMVGVKVQGMAIREWTDSATGQLVQLEARVETESQHPHGIVAWSLPGNTPHDAAALAAARRLIAASGDPALHRLSSERVWTEGHLVLAVTAKARFGEHDIAIDLASLKAVAHTYKPYPKEDDPSSAGEQSIQARVYPLYEESGGQLLERTEVSLPHILKSVRLPTVDPFATLRERPYPMRLEDSVRSETPEGQAQGYWSMQQLEREAQAAATAVPLAANDFAHGAVFLTGRYATVAIDPRAFAAFPGITLPKRLSAEVRFDLKGTEETSNLEIVPEAALLGRPLVSAADALGLEARRDPQQNPAVYINGGYDQVQVYYAINQLFEQLRPRGFTDPDLSERPFHAFLYQPDVEIRDNAYYDDDTINFATYSPGKINMARDNTTIWHELGHGVMDRLMGTQIELDDTGGLSEGMADFVSDLVVEGVTGGQPYLGLDQRRINNNTGFYLTNEEHDDGEAYGGTMKDILDLAMARYGHEQGLTKVTGLILEAMRLCRDNPALTAEGWFDHVLFADLLGRPGVREKGELRPLIEQALASRNFAAKEARAQFDLLYQGKPVIAGTAGSRYVPVKLTLAPDAVTTQELQVHTADGQGYKFRYPLQVRVYYRSGPLQGAVHWEGEEQEPEVHLIETAGTPLTLTLKARGTCDRANQSDGSCSDFAYIQVWNAGATRPVAKKRFYLQITTQQPAAAH